MAVAIQIQKRRRSAPARLGDASGGGDVLEPSAAVVAQQYVGANVGHVEIDVAIVVVVASRNAHAVAITIGDGRAWIEVAIAAVEIEAIDVLRALLSEKAALDEVDV